MVAVSQALVLFDKNYNPIIDKEISRRYGKKFPQKIAQKVEFKFKKLHTYRLEKPKGISHWNVRACTQLPAMLYTETKK